MACAELQTVIDKYISPPTNSTKRRGYKYDSPEKLIRNKKDKELRIPAFQTVIKGTKMTRENARKEVVNFMYEASHGDVFTHDPITTFCLGVELFDKVMLTIKKLNFRCLKLFGIVCLWLAGKIHIDYFEVYVNACDLVHIMHYYDITYSTKDVVIVESLILESLHWCVSSRYTVPWFVDYLDGFKNFGVNSTLYDEIAKWHISGQYRLKDPYTCATEILTMMGETGTVGHKNKKRPL